MRIAAGDRERSSRRLASVAVYAAGPVALIVILWLRQIGLIAEVPMHVMAAVILGTGVVNLTASIWLARRPASCVLLHVRVALAVLCTAAVIYTAGWGPVLVVAYVLSAAELMRTVGPRTARPILVWMWVGILVGELSVATGSAPSMIEPALGHAVAVVGGLLATIVTDVLARSARAAEDATARLSERGRHFESLIENAADIIGVITTKGEVLSVSPASRAMLGYSPEEAKGRPITDFLHPEFVPLLEPLLGRVVAERGNSVTIETRLLHRDGTVRIVIATLSSPSEEWGEQIIMNLHDVTKQRNLEEQLRHEASHDALTGLLNRGAFGEESERVCERAARNAWTVGMLYIDLDGFKQINDSLGHETGDRVLVETARRLAGCLRDEEIVARLGGDEFGVLIPSVAESEQLIRIAERILRAVSAPIPGLPSNARVGASIGIAMRSDEGIEISTLMRHADEAMYSAKRNGRARWELSREGGASN